MYIFVCLSMYTVHSFILSNLYFDIDMCFIEKYEAVCKQFINIRQLRIIIKIKTLQQEQEILYERSNINKLSFVDIL